MGHDIPAEILPAGVNMISKKSRMDSFRGNTLNELNVNETLVSYI